MTWRGPSRARAAGAYMNLGNSPLKRKCPRCQAPPGERCWNLRAEIYPMRVSKPHAERKAQRPKEEPT